MKNLAFVLLIIFLLPCKLWAAEHESVHMVVQQDGQALVNEVRSFALPKETGTILVPDLPESLIPQTLQVRSQSSPKALKLLGITRNGALLTPSSIMGRSLGKKVVVTLPDGKTRAGRIQKEAVLLTASEPPLLLIDGRVYAGPVEAITYTEAPQGLTARPEFALNVINTGPVRQDLSLTYVAREIGWSMGYVLTINKTATSGQLSGWVTLTNQSGKSFAQANIDLLAGDLKSAQPVENRKYLASSPMMARALSPNASTDEAFEYHVYKLKHRVSLADQQSRQEQLFESTTIPLIRKLIGTAQALPYSQPAEPVQQDLDIVLSFRNAKAAGLGLPLPKGSLRAIQEDGDAVYPLGENTLPHTPAGSTAKIVLGKAFDLKIERVMTEYEKTGKNSYHATWELRITNAKSEPQRITLQEQIPGKWKVETASQKWAKASAGMLEFNIDVPPTGEGAPFVLTYTFNTER